MKVLCPACETELDPSNTHCPVCLRPRSRKELMKGLQQGRKASKSKVLPPLLVTAALLLAGYVLTHRGELGSQPAAVAVQAPAPVPAPPTEAPAAAPPDSLGGNVTVLSRGPGAAVPDDEAPAKVRPARAARADLWTVGGQVYDLLSLKPVAGTRLVFQDRESGKAYAATTDGRGAYRVALPKVSEGGYDLTVAHRGYGGYLEEMSPPYRNQSRERRGEAAQEAAQSSVLHVPLLPEKNEDAVKYDLVLLRR